MEPSKKQIQIAEYYKENYGTQDTIHYSWSGAIYAERIGKEYFSNLEEMIDYLQEEGEDNYIIPDWVYCCSPVELVSRTVENILCDDFEELYEDAWSSAKIHLAKELAELDKALVDFYAQAKKVILGVEIDFGNIFILPEIELYPKLTFNYKGYKAVASYDSMLDSYCGAVVDSEAVITFVGDDKEELLEALLDSVEDYLEWLEDTDV